MPLLLTVPKHYPYVLMGLAAHFLFFMTLNPFIGLKARKSTFTAEFLAQFEEDHAKAFPLSKIDQLG